MAVITIVIALCAWLPGSGDPFREGRVRILAYIGAPILAILVSRWIPWMLCILWVWLAWLWVYWGMDSYGWEEVILPAAFMLVAGHIVAFGGEKAVMLGIRVSYGIQLAIGILQILNLDLGLFDGSATGIAGTMGHFTLLGCFLAPLVPVALFRWTWVEAFLGLMVVVATGSAMSAAALGAAIVIMFWKSIGLRLALATAGLGLSGVGLLWLQDPASSFLATSGRAQVWKTAWGFWLEHPHGWGPGSWRGLYPHWNIAAFSDHQWLELHNDWLQLLFEGGWLAVALAVMFTVGLVKTTRNPVKATIVGSLAVAACGNFVLHFPATAFLFCLAIFLPEPDDEVFK